MTDPQLKFDEEQKVMKKLAKKFRSYKVLEFES